MLPPFLADVLLPESCTDNFERLENNRLFLIGYTLYRNKFFITWLAFSEFCHYDIKIVCPLGAPILPHLLRCRAFAVVHYSFIPCALHMRQTRLLQNSGINIISYDLMIRFKK